VTQLALLPNTSLFGLKVKMPHACKCGGDLARIDASDGASYATLYCATCAARRGSLSEQTAKWIEAVAGMFGAPAAISLRRLRP
jgi:hypothetical protein